MITCICVAVMKGHKEFNNFSFFLHYKETKNSGRFIGVGSCFVSLSCKLLQFI